MRFKPEIEGLRGVAVLLVVLAHAGTPGFAGGFVGVDIFFVISGFLITGLLLEELRDSGRIDYWSFYARRARRLAPAMLVMIATVSAIAIAVVPWVTLEAQISAALWAVLWAANVHFSFGGFEYFGGGPGENLFLHTWSLAVEEQFYLLWPALIALLWRRGGVGIGPLAAATVLGFFVGLALLAWNANAAYYLMPSRLWQLSLGGLVYQVAMKAELSRGRAPTAAGWLGAGLLAVSLYWIDGSRPYPGSDALLPSAAAACLLFAGFNGAGVVSRMLAAQMLRLPGRISYSWYLWHWPFLLILPVMGVGKPTPHMTAGLVLASFLVAWISHGWVEEPFRRTRKAPRRTVAMALLASASLAIALLWAGHVTAPSEEQRDGTLEAKVFASIRVPGVYARQDCDQWYRSSDLVPCTVVARDAGAAGSQGVIVLIGDSVGAQWLPALEATARKWRHELVVLTKSSCPVVDVPFFYARINRRYTECEDWLRKAIAYVETKSPAVVVIGSSQYEFTGEEWEQGTRRMVDRLAGGSRPVLILAPTPLPGFHGPRCVVARGRLVNGRMDAPACTALLRDTDPADTIGHLRNAVATGVRAEVVYLNDLVCQHGQCSALKDGLLVYGDEHHLNAEFVETISPEVELRLDSALERLKNR